MPDTEAVTVSQNQHLYTCCPLLSSILFIFREKHARHRSGDGQSKPAFIYLLSAFVKHSFHLPR
ncbi:hypothetical protein QUF80_01320, partial [Desulfococcaceae bacterium HSG8]|nr:hypothetical protein [Desulfococcaceae bacterium HSG8]